MKALYRQQRFIKAVTCILLSWLTVSSNSQTLLTITNFEITVVPSSLMIQPIEKFTLKKDELWVLKRSKLGKDSVVFTTKLNPTDTLRLISEINLNKFRDYYFNNCIDDGSRVSVAFKRNNETKTVLLDNYYHEDIGTIINFINSIVPTKYKIWYDKEKLITDYKNCKSNN